MVRCIIFSFMLISLAVPCWAGELEELRYKRMWLDQLIRSNQLENQLAQRELTDVDKKINELTKKQNDPENKPEDKKK
jgi:hypothetical protein